MRFPAAVNRAAGAASPAACEGAAHPLQQFHERLGGSAITRHDALWIGAGRFSLVTFPNNQRVAATKRDIQRLLVDCGRLVAVFCPLEGTGPTVTEYRLSDKDYGPGRLQEQFHKHVRRHAGGFVTREVTWDEMAKGGVAIHADVAARRRNAAPELTDHRRWAEACEAAACTAGIFAYGCLVDDTLAGYVVAWRERGVCHGVLINRDSRFDSRRSSNVLLHAFSRDQIGREDTSTINLGRSWYPPKPSLNSFKRHAGYEEREAVLAVVLHPWVESVLRASWTHRCLKSIGALTGGRLNFGDDVRLFEAAGLTELPS